MSAVRTFTAAGPRHSPYHHFDALEAIYRDLEVQQFDREMLDHLAVVLHALGGKNSASFSPDALAAEAEAAAPVTVTLQNVGWGVRGVHCSGGEFVYFERDETRTVTLPAVHLAALRKTGEFTVDGEITAMQGAPADIERLRRDAEHFDIDFQPSWGAQRLNEEVRAKSPPIYAGERPFSRGGGIT